MTEPAPLVSVLLPVRDGARHLDEALASIAAQDLVDWELIAVDDGSADETPSILLDWGSRDHRVRVLRQSAEGIVRALERARSAARSPFLARMDADDVAEPGRLGAQLALMRARPDLSGCGCRVRYFPDHRVRDGARRYEAWINGLVTPDQIERAIFVECPIAHPTLFVRADALASVGGYRATEGPEDYDLLLRMWAEGHRFATVPRVLLHWREGPERLSRTDARYSPQSFLAAKTEVLVSTLLRGDRGAVIWGAGPVGKAVSQALRARGIGLEAFVELDPRKIGQEIHGAPVVDTETGLRMEGPLHLAAVGQEGARGRIEALLEGAGMRALEDFVAVA